MLHKRERFLRIRPSTMAARCSAHGASLCEATIPNAVRGILLPRAPRSQPLKEPKRKAVSAQKRGGPSVGTIVSRKSDAAAQIAERPAAARPHATPAGTLIQSNALYQSAKRGARHFLRTERRSARAFFPTGQWARSIAYADVVVEGFEDQCVFAFLVLLETGIERTKIGSQSFQMLDCRSSVHQLFRPLDKLADVEK